MKIQSTIDATQEQSNENQETEEVEKVDVPLFARFLEKPQRVKTHVKAGLAKACCRETC